MGLMFILYLALHYKLPRLKPQYDGSYVSLMKSIWQYFKAQPALRLAAARGALSFAGLSAMWTTLVFLLEDSFGYGSSIAGVFGILGIVGALGSTVVGKLNDRVNKDKMILSAVLMLLLSWVVFLCSTHFIPGLVFGAIVVDLGQQTVHITNQNLILKKNPEARNRVNTIYMVIFFIGGAIGTSLGALAYVHWGWHGVSVLGLVLSLLIAVVHYRFREQTV